jgi:hypothetical protein
MDGFFVYNMKNAIEFHVHCPSAGESFSRSRK